MAKSGGEDLARFVKRIIKQKGLRLRDVERNSGGKITNGYVSGIINGNITNLTIEKIAALALGLGVDGREVFAAAYVPPDPIVGESYRINPSDALFVLEMMQNVVVSPTLLEILQEAMRLSPDKQKGMLEALRRQVTSEGSPEPNSKPD